MCVSFVDSQEIQEVELTSQLEMLYARDVIVDAFSVQVESVAFVALAFGGLIYKMLISRPKLAAATTVFVVSLVSFAVTDACKGCIMFASFVQIPTGGLRFVRHYVDLH